MNKLMVKRNANLKNWFVPSVFSLSDFFYVVSLYIPLIPPWLTMNF